MAQAAGHELPDQPRATRIDLLTSRGEACRVVPARGVRRHQRSTRSATMASRTGRSLTSIASLVISPFVGAPAIERLASRGSGRVQRDRPLRRACEAGRCNVRRTRRGRRVRRRVLTRSMSTTQTTTMRQHGGRGLDRPRALRPAREGVRRRTRRRAAVYIGSANATVAAFQRNVEFLVELDGSAHPPRHEGCPRRCRRTRTCSRPSSSAPSRHPKIPREVLQRTLERPPTSSRPGRCVRASSPPARVAGARSCS